MECAIMVRFLLKMPCHYDILKAYIIHHIPEIDGFFGASSIEHLASERGMTAQAAAFKAIQK